MKTMLFSQLCITSIYLIFPKQYAITLVNRITSIPDTPELRQAQQTTKT